MQQRTPQALVVEGLRGALEAHRQGRFLEIDGKRDDADAGAHDDERVAIALRFWEAWADSAAHKWRYEGEVTVDDWPRMAEHVLHALETGEPITDPMVLAYFGPDVRAPSRMLRPRLVAVASILAVAVAAFAVVGRVADGMPGLPGTMLLLVSFFVLPILTLVALRSANRRIEEKYGRESEPGR